MLTLRPVLQLHPVFRLSVSSLLILFAMSCGNQTKADAQYITVITLPQKMDSAEINEQIERAKLVGRKIEIVPIDTTFIRENISSYIIPIVRGAECVKEIQDLSNNDSSILVLEIKEDYDIYQASYDIYDLLKVKRTNMPENMNDPIVIRGRLNEKEKEK